jgi:hypothetical protein
MGDLGARADRVVVMARGIPGQPADQVDLEGRGHVKARTPAAIRFSITVRRGST